jgi:cobalt-precorrin 5A hydrolase
VTAVSIPRITAPGIPCRRNLRQGEKTMTIALITLSPEGARLLSPLAGRLPGARLYLHDSIPWPPPETTLESAPAEANEGHSLQGKAAQPGEPPEGRNSPKIGQAAGDATATEPTGATQPGEMVKGPASAKIGEAPAPERFAKIADLTAALFPVCRGLVYAAPCGVVVRAIAALLKDKRTDPAVVALDAGGRWAVSLLSGHEGGANDLAFAVANLTGAEPVITTTTEALKTIIVGVGCRRGTPAAPIVAAIRATLTEFAIGIDAVRLIASADLKADEPGLIEAALTLGLPLRFIAGAEIRTSTRHFSQSAFVEEKVNLPAVAEPAALLAGRRTQLLCPKKTFKGIAVALARESSSSSG